MKIAIAEYCLVVGVLLIGSTLRAKLQQARKCHNQIAAPTLVIGELQDRQA